MKTFDFNLAKQGAPVCTGIGLIVVIEKMENEGDYPISGYIVDGIKHISSSWTEDGFDNIDQPDGSKEWEDCQSDLFMLDYKDSRSPIFGYNWEYCKSLLDEFYIPYYKELERRRKDRYDNLPG